MKKLLTFILILPLTSFGSSECSHRTDPNVFLLTLDGVRSHEFFEGTSSYYFNRRKIEKDERGVIFEKLWQIHVHKGALYGNNGFGGRYKINSKVAVSLPSYQAMMLGKSTDCKSNGCDRISEISLPERIQRELSLSENELAIFASWSGISRAIESGEESLTSSIGVEGFDDGTNDSIFRELSNAATTDIPKWSGAKKDKYTIEMALHYLEKHCPRFLYLSLDDSDEYGHLKDYPNYVKSLSSYDDLIDRIIKKLSNMNEYGKNTTLLVTTDHSRGPFFLWKTHGVTKISEKNSFLFLYGRGVPPVGRLHKSKQSFNHDWLRPTIEKLMGLKPINEKILPVIAP